MILKNMRAKRLFSLIEMMVVLFIIALILSFLLPAIKLLQSKSQQIVCSNNYKQIYTLMNLYSSDNDGHLPRTNPYDYYHRVIIPHPANASLKTIKPAGNTLGWHGHLAPYIQKMENNNWHLHPNNVFMKALYAGDNNPWNLFVCPSAARAGRVSMTRDVHSSIRFAGLPFSYMANAEFIGLDYQYENNDKNYSVRLDDIEDPSGKILLFESSPFIPDNPTYNRVKAAKHKLPWAFSAAADPFFYYSYADRPEGDPGYWGFWPAVNHHGAMNFLHDDDNSLYEGYQLNLFADGSVLRKHEWWLYINAEALGSVKGNGIRN